MADSKNTLFFSSSQPDLEIKAEILRISFRNPENGWSVVKAKNCENSDLFTITGHFPMINIGQIFQLKGNWSQHPQYGQQFKVNKSIPLRPNTVAGILNYLSSGILKGVGEKTASKIVKVFGAETFNVLDKSPEKLSAVPTLGKKKIRAIIESWKAQKEHSELLMFLNSYEIGQHFADKILKLYGESAISIISANPFQLAYDIPGIGFITADRIARNLGLAPDSPLRIEAAILYVLNQAEEHGHCFMSRGQIADALVSLLSLDKEDLLSRLHTSLGSLVNEGKIVQDSAEVFGEGETDVYFSVDLYFAEVSSAEKIKELFSDVLPINDERVDSWIARYGDKYTLSEEQKSAVKAAVKGRIFILTGGPGVGKTTTARAIISLFKAMKRPIALAAPTGRAAQRLLELTGEEARTIHRLLEWAPHTCLFERNEENPLEVDSVLVDESSMLDIRLFSSLLRALPQDSRLLLIGDVDQLPSVGPGNVLRDLISSRKIPCLTLDKIFRQVSFSRIIQAAHSINKGIIPVFERQEESDCWFIEKEDPEDIKKEIIRLISEELPERFGFDPIRDIQVLTPMNKGILGTLQLNKELQGILNKAPSSHGAKEIEDGSGVLKPGDKVIQSVNNYDHNVFNGDIGYVKHFDFDNGCLAVRFGQRLVVFKKDEIPELRLAYAITVHKSQGSEFPAVIIPVSMQNYIMLQRNLIYTAVTRAKKLAIFVGTSRAFSYAVKNARTSQRQTKLLDRIKY